MRIYHELIERGDNPKFFLENVEMGKKWESVFNETMGRKGIHINSALVSAQNRRRIYWTDIHDDIPQPEDRGILLRDILEEEVDEKYFLSDKMIECLKGRVKTEKFSPVQFSPIKFPYEQKARTINTRLFKMGDNDNYIQVDNDPICVAMRGRESACLTPKRTEYGKKIRKEYEAGIVKEQRKNILYINSSDFSAQMRARYYWCNWEIPAWKDKGILFKDIITDGYVEKDKSWCMLESWNRFAKNPESLLRRYKKSLTPLIFNSPDCNPEKGFRTPNITEAERLQTVPEGYTKSVQPHIGMGLLGNGWTVDVISHILKGLKNEPNS